VLVAVATLATIGACCAPRAHAQEEPQLFRLYLGAYFPAKSQAADVFGSAIFSWGMTFDVPPKKPSPVVPTIYFDGVWAFTDEFRDLEVSFHYLALGPAVRYYLGEKEPGAEPKKSRFYVGGGLGAYYLSTQLVDDDGFYIETIDNDFKFGGKLMAGVDFGKSLVLEGAYVWPGASDAQGWDLRVGFRF
jgi:hypothetical protein